jgi:hypothetical protein
LPDSKVVSINRKVTGEPRTHLQDWNYLHTNDFELTLELGCVKYPEHGQLAAFWQENREPLLKYLEAVHLGVKGGHQIFYFFFQCGGSGMFIPDPGSDFFPSRIPDPNCMLKTWEDFYITKNINN